MLIDVRQDHIDRARLLLEDPEAIATSVCAVALAAQEAYGDPEITVGFTTIGAEDWDCSLPAEVTEFIQDLMDEESEPVKPISFHLEQRRSPTC